MTWIPPSRRSRGIIIVAAVLVFFVLILPSGHVGRLGTTLTGKGGKPALSKEHPIKQFHEEGMRRFEQVIERQSKSLEEAVAEYKRRYNRDPPPGFDRWYEFAVFKNSAIIDEFDMILEELQPWEHMDPAVIRRVYERSAHGIALSVFGVHDGVIIADEESWMGKDMRELLKDLAPELPNFSLFINALDEPRVLLTTRGDTEIIHWSDESKVSAWARVEGPCHYRKSGKGPHLPALSQVEAGEIPFVSDHWNSIDICKNPQFETQHGFLIAPYSFYITTSPVPILSQAKPSTFGDILAPSMWYYNHNMENLDEIDTAWADKKPALYWAGSTTGGVMRDLPDEDGTPVLSHRLRFIRTTKQLGAQIYNFLTREPRTGYWVKSTSDQIGSELYDTKFVSVVQCEGEHCSKATDDYQVGDRESAETAFQYRFLMDLDGNSFSGRFYNFLRSASCPLKSTIFREWHDERLVPWVHYVPISVGMEDLPEAMRYLATTEEGTAIAQTIAQMGREWHDKFLRREDAAVYLYRLFLEYGRLMDPDRTV